MSCVEKRHMSHRVGSMLHHRFPNGFTDLFMDDTDREVSTLTDRAFRSLCVGDDAVYNDEFLYGYSPFSCYKPLAGEPVKKTHHKEAKKQGLNKIDKNFTQSWTQQQHENLSQMSSLLKAFSATEESCEGMLIKNGAMTDVKGESWDKSALRSIQRELSEFSSDYPTNLTDGHYKNCHRHHSGDGPSTKTGKDAPPPSGKSSKNKNGKPNVKLRKLNIKNFFLHSELSPFQTWKDFNQFPFGQEDTVLPTDSIPKWYDLPFYKELTEAHKQETQHAEEVQPGQKALELPPSTAPKPIPPPPPPKVLPKPSATPATPAGKRCSSEVGDGSAAPWRRNKSRAKSAIPLNQSGIPPQENISKQVDESLFLMKKEARSVEVKAVEEICSLASTPFSICQLMTPLIPSRQPTETSEILQGVLSPSALDLPLRPHSEAKSTPEPPVKRESYKSLASSILFNLKDNRKRVKSRYSPPKFKTLEVPEGDSQSPQSDSIKHSQAGSEGNASRLSTPAVLREGFTVCSPVLESNNSPSAGHPICDTDGPLSDDYLLSNLLQTKRETAGINEENSMSSLMHNKKSKSPVAVKQNYPSLNLYKKASPAESDTKYLQVPPTAGAPVQINQPVETNKPSPIAINKERSPKTLPTNTGLSSNTLNVNKDSSPLISPHVLEKEGISTNAPVRKIQPTIPDKSKQPIKELRETDMGLQPVTPKDKDTSIQPLSTKDVIRAAREAINAAKNRALMAAQSDSNDKAFKDKELKENEIGRKVDNSKETFSIKSLVPENNSTGYQSRSDADALDKTGDVKKEPPPVPKRNFAKSDIQLALDKQQANIIDEITNDDSGNTNLDLPTKENESNQKQAKSKHIFSARQNNYIKYHRYAETDDKHGEESKEGDAKVNTRREADEEVVSLREVKDCAHLSNDLHALKELQRAKLGDRVLDNIRNRLGVFNIDEEAKAKNDLISRELRNIKKGMLSMRGNTTAKRDLFTKKEKEQIKPEAFTKIDSNVIVNKALINDNYDKAKMALEEIISERQKRNNQKEQDANPVLDENVGDRSYVTRVQQRKQAMKDSAEEAREKQTGYTHSQKESDVRERLGDLRDHNHIRNILSQTEPGHEETFKSTNHTALPGLNKTGNEPSSNTKTKRTFADDKLPNNPGYESEVKNLDRQLSEESGDSMVNQTGGRRKNAPPVPPRSKKGGSTTKETGSLKDFAEFDIFTNEEKCENEVERLKKMAAGSDEQEVVSDLFFKDPVHSPIETYADKKLWDMVPGVTYTFVPEAVLTESELPLQYPLSENTICSSPELREDENKANNFLSDMAQTGEATLESSTDIPQVVNKVKRKAPLKPEYLKTVDNETKSLVEAGPDKISTAFEEMNMGTEGHSESPRKIISPLLLVNGLSINQSPPDHASLSSKSSYFSVESALQRNTETESNVYHSLENLIGEEEGADEVKQITLLNTKRDSDRTEVEYYSLSDHESEPEFVRQSIKSPNKEEMELPYKVIQEEENASTEPQDEQNQTPISPSNTFSPALGIPALFKVKDNTFSNKLKKSVQPWSPRGSFSVPTKEEEVNQVRENPKVPLINEPAADEITAIQDQTFKPKEILTSVSPPLLLSPSNLQTENPKKPQVGGFLAVPQEEDRFSGVSPCSEGVESVTTSTVDTADEMGANDELLLEREVLKVPSERSGSTCSGNDSQTGLPKPPAVLPKSEKAVQRAMKLATRRMKKEEAQKTSQRSSHSSSKHRVTKHRGENPEHKSSSSSSKNSKSSERKHRERTEDGHSESHHDKDSNDLNEQHHERRSHSSDHPLNKKDLRQETRRQSHDSAESSNLSSEALPDAATERQGRRNNKQIRDKPQQRHYSSDRVISNVPVYKAQVGDRPVMERSFQRSLSSDRFTGDKVERRLSNDMTANERLDPRSQRIEKSIMEELQQRGRVRDKTTRDNPLRRSHSIDAYSTEVSHPSTLSRQSSHTSQLSRQSSIEHAIVTQSFPMTQRKLLQDPDSGQYFFVDMPVQVKTKTFFDPETGSYVQLPVQPPEGAVPHVSPLEVLTPPMVVYHGFVPVPLSPMAQKAPIQATQMPPEEFEQRHLEMSRQMLFQERHPYVEPVYGQHDHILGEFLGTEELDCPS